MEHDPTAWAGKEACHKHLLTPLTPLPGQKVVLTVTHKKTQLIQVISRYIVYHFVKNENENEFILTPEDPVAVAVEKGLITKKSDMINTHEEANVIFVNQLAGVCSKAKLIKHIKCDDIDVFVLVYFYCKEELDCAVTMQSLLAGQSVTYIKASAI